MLLHNLRAVVDSKDDIGDARGGEGLDLVLDHGLVGELDERLGEGEGLALRSAWVLLFAQCLAAGGTGDGLLLKAARQAGKGQRGHTRGRRRVPKPPTRIIAIARVSMLHHGPVQRPAGALAAQGGRRQARLTLHLGGVWGLWLCVNRLWFGEEQKGRGDCFPLRCARETSECTNGEKA